MANYQPTLGERGVFTLDEPFASTYEPGDYVLVVEALRSFEQLAHEGEDVYEEYYAPHDIDEETYEEDSEAGDVYIVTFIEDGGSFRFSVPNSYIDGPPETDIIDYQHLIVSMDLGAVPEDFDTSLLEEDYASQAKSIIGIEPDIHRLVAPHTGIITRDEHESLEADREEKKSEVDSDYMRFVKEKDRRQDLESKVETLEKLIIDSGIIPQRIEDPEKPEASDSESDRESLHPPVTIKLEDAKVDENDEHKATSWELYRSSDDTLLDEVSESEDKLTEYTIDRDLLEEDTDYYVKARFHSREDKVGDWSDGIKFSTKRYFSHIAAYLEDGTLARINPETLEEIDSSLIEEGMGQSAFDEHRCVLFISPNNVRLVDTYDLETLENRSVSNIEIHAWDSAWSTVYVADTEGYLYELDENLETVSDFRPFTARIAAIDHDSDRLYAVSWSYELAVIDPSDMTVAERVDLYEERPTSLAVGSERIYIGFEDGRVEILDKGDLSEKASYKRHDEAIIRVDVLDSEEAVSLSEDGQFHIFNDEGIQQGVYEPDDGDAQVLVVAEQNIYAGTDTGHIARGETSDFVIEKTNDDLDKGFTALSYLSE